MGHQNGRLSKGTAHHSWLRDCLPYSAVEHSVPIQQLASRVTHSDFVRRLLECKANVGDQVMRGGEETSEFATIMPASTPGTECYSRSLSQLSESAPYACNEQRFGWSGLPRNSGKTLRIKVSE